MSTDTETHFNPIYMSWSTFDNTIDGFRAVGLPEQIDRSVLRSRSGGDQTQFLRAAASFGFIEEDGTPTARFRQYVEEPESRPAIMREVLNECYPNVVGLSANATSQQLTDQFRSFGIEGDTVRKAIAFYLNAARFAELPLSPHFKITRPGAGGRKSTRRSSSRKPTEEEPPRDTPPSPDPFKDLHPAIVTMVQSLPAFTDTATKPVFPDAEREAWFAYAKATFDLIYSRPEGKPGGSSS